MPIGWVQYIILAVFLSIAVVSDIKSGKIKNWLTISGAVIGVIINMLVGGMQQASSSLVGLGVMAAFGLLLFAIGVFGGGDAKLLMAVGSITGLNLVPSIIVLTAIAGGLLAVGYLIRRCGFRELCNRMCTVARLLFCRMSPAGSLDPDKKKLPYSLAIAAGTIAAILLDCL